jgi:ribonuclease HI
MPLARKTYRGCKVWVEVDPQGKVLENRGLAQIQYRREGPERYSVKVAELGEVPLDPGPVAVDGSAAEVPTADRDASAAKAPASRAPKRPRKPRAPKAPRAKAATGSPAVAASKDDTIVAYADGSCFGNPGPCGVGVLLEWRGQTKEISKFLGEGTNNIAELTAIEIALQQVKRRELPVRVHTDSAYSIGVLQEGWKAKENLELVRRVQALMREFEDLRLVKVRGHAGDPRNERVDQLARDAITRRA